MSSNDGEATGLIHSKGNQVPTKAPVSVQKVPLGWNI